MTDLLLALLALGVLAAAVPLLGHVLLAAAGWQPARFPRRPLRHHLPVLLDRLALDLLAGVVLLFAVLLLLDLASVPWRWWALAPAGLAVGGLLALVARRRREGTEGSGPSAPLGWGDGVAAAALAFFAAAAWSRRANISDFVYHWGLKGKRYWLEGGIDVAFLTDPLGLTDHPDYPNLLPALYAVTAEALGRFRERAMLAWSVLFLALLLLFARRALTVALAERDGAPRWAVRGGTLATALVAVAFAVGHQLAGGGDLVVALAVVAALPALLTGHGEEERRLAAGDLQVGLAAALAAGAKIEGVPLAVFLVAARWWQVAGAPRRGALRRWGAAQLRRLPRLALPVLLVAGPWLVECLRHDLFRGTNTGSFDTARWGEIWPAVGQVFNMEDWHRLPWLLLLLPPLFLLPRLRPAVLVLHLQAAFYLFVYLTAPVDTTFYVLSSLPRLLYHLVVPALVLVVVGAVYCCGSSTSGSKAAVSN